MTRLSIWRGLSLVWALPWSPAALAQEALNWETNTSFPTFAAKEAKTGGTVTDFILSFPLTMRQVGPDSNGSFRSLLDAQDMSLIQMHPNTQEIVPGLASHWAYGADGKSCYYRLDSRARWSDGKPVTGADFAYALEFYRSKFIVAPWYNEWFTTQIENIEVLPPAEGQEVVKITLPAAKPDLWYHCNMSPRPKHFYGTLDKDFVQKFNWKLPPNTGPYQVSDFQKGKSITFSRKKDWWAAADRFNQYRFNIDKVIIKVIREQKIAWEHLLRGELDAMAVTQPEYWHEKAKGPLFDNGYIHKLWFYNDAPRSDYGLYLNNDFELFKDRNVRLGFQHAMNVDKVIKQLLRGEYDRLQGISQGYGKYTNPEIRARAFDLNKAAEYFKAAGWVQRGGDGILLKDGRRLEALVTYGQENMTPRLVVLKEEARKAGIDLKLQVMDSASNFKSYLEKKHQIAFMGWSTSFRPEYREHFHSAEAHKPQTNNLTNTDNKELDPHLDAYRNAIDEPTRIKEAHLIQKMVHDEASIIPLFLVPYFRQAYWPWLKLPEPKATRESEDLGYFGLSSGGMMWVDEPTRLKVKAAQKAKKPLPKGEFIDETYRLKI